MPLVRLSSRIRPLGALTRRLACVMAAITTLALLACEDTTPTVSIASGVVAGVVGSASPESSSATVIGDADYTAAGTCDSRTKSLEVRFLPNLEWVRATDIATTDSDLDCFDNDFTLVIADLPTRFAQTADFFPFTLELRQNMGAGYSAAMRFKGTYFTAAPILTVTTPAESGYISSANAGAVPITGTCNMDGSKITVTSGLVTSTTKCTSNAFATSLNLASLSDGSVTLTVAYDSFDDTIIDPIERTVTKDSIKPATPVIGTASTTFSTTFTLSVTQGTPLATDFADFHYTIDGSSPTCDDSTLSSSSQPAVITIPNATTPLAVVSCDAAGNPSTTATATYTFDPGPALTAIVPALGTTSGGTIVTITGAHFQSTSYISVGGAVCGSSVLESDSQITCLTAPHAAGTTDVVITNPDARTATLTNAYTYTVTAAPVITALSPAAGIVTGGSTITITGTGFNTGATITLGGSACATQTLSATQIVCTTSAHAAGTVDAIVTNPDSQIALRAASFTYTTNAAPTVSAISPNIGALAGGQTVNITGTGFLSGATVRIGTVPCASVVVNSYTSLSCTTGVGLVGIYPVTVINTDSQYGTRSSIYTYTSQPAPTVTSLAPASGAASGGTNISITGTGFLADAVVLIGTSTCQNAVVHSATSLSCTTPAGTAGTYTVTVTNVDSQYGTKSGGYTYLGPITITSLLPTSGPVAGGTTITINGSGFANPAVVTISGMSCTPVTVVSSTQLQCPTPAASAGTYSATVTNPDGQTATRSSAFTYQSPPVISTVSPATVSPQGGTMITLTGAGFMAGSVINVGGAGCVSQTYVSSTSFTCVTPAHAEGTVDVTITNPDDQSSTLSGPVAYAKVYSTMELITGYLSPAGFEDGVNAASRIQSVSGFAKFGNYLYFTDTGNRAIRRLDVTTKTLTTLAGSPAYDAGCTPGVGDAARFSAPSGIAIDPAGENLYISDTTCAVLFKLALATNTVTVLKTSVGSIYALAFDPTGTWLYGTSTTSSKVVKINPTTGAITTFGAAINSYIRGLVVTSAEIFVGDYSSIWRVALTDGTTARVAGGSSGSADGNGLSASFYNPYGLSLVGSTLTIADSYTSRVRQMDINTYDVTTISDLTGTSSYPDSAFKSGTLGLGAFIGSHYATTILSDGTDLYFATNSSNSYYNHLIIRYRASDNSIDALAGPNNGSGTTMPTFQAGIGTASRPGTMDSYSNIKLFQGPNDDQRMLYGIGTASTSSDALFKLHPTTRVLTQLNSGFTSLAGITAYGNYMYLGSASSSSTSAPKYNLSTGGTGFISLGGSGAARHSVVADGHLFVINGHAIKKVDLTTYTATDFVGSTSTGFVDGTGTNARFYNPYGLWYDGTTYLYVTDRSNNAIRRVTLADGTVTTFAGNAGGGSGYIDNANPLLAKFYYPISITGDGTYLYVTDSNNHAIRRVEIATGAVTTLAGRARSTYNIDHPGLLTSATIAYPSGIDIDTTTQAIYVSNSTGIFVIQ